MNSPFSLHPKVAGAGGGGGASLVLVWILGLLHVQIPAEAVVGLTTVLAMVGGWLAPVLTAERDRIVEHDQPPKPVKPR